MITEEIQTDINTLHGLGYLVQSTAHYSLYADDASHLKEALDFISNSMYATLKSLDSKVSIISREDK
jgi:uncharacterized protein YebE (UPF0316 family)